MNENSVSTGLWSKNFVLITAANFFLCFGYHMLATTLPVYVSTINGSAFSAGMIVGVITIIALLTRPFVGYALDTMGRKKILLIGLLIFACAIISYEWASLSLIFISCAFQGMGWAFTTTSLGTLVSDVIEPKRRAEGIGYFGFSINLSLALGPLTGIWIMQQFGFSVLFLMAALSTVLCFLLVQFIGFPSVQSEKFLLSKETLLEKTALFPSLLIMLVTITYGGIVSSLTLFGEEAGIENVGSFFLACAIMIMIARTFAGKIADRKGRGIVLVPGVIALAIGLLLLSNSKETILLTIAATFYGFGFGSIQPTLQAWMLNRVPTQRRGAATGTYLSAFDLGIGAGAILLSFIAKETGYAAIYLISIVFMILFGVIYGVHSVRERNQIKMNSSMSHDG